MPEAVERVRVAYAEANWGRIEEWHPTPQALYDVDAYSESLEGRAPEDTLLSHDLFEGLYARTALVTDVEVVDDYPSSVLAHARRQQGRTLEYI